MWTRFLFAWGAIFSLGSCVLLVLDVYGLAFSCLTIGWFGMYMGAITERERVIDQYRSDKRNARNYLFNVGALQSHIDSLLPDWDYDQVRLGQWKQGPVSLAYNPGKKLVDEYVIVVDPDEKITTPKKRTRKGKK